MFVKKPPGKSLKSGAENYLAKIEKTHLAPFCDYECCLIAPSTSLAARVPDSTAPFI